MALKKNIKFSFLYITLLPFLFGLISLSNIAFAQNEIEGVWLSEKDDYMIKITTFGSEFQARIVWLRNENEPDGTIKMDKNNPDEKYRKIPIKGLKIITDLKYHSENTWQDGKIYLPEKGKYFRCQVTITGNKMQLTIIDDNDGSSQILGWTRQE